jgi:hypothetical protein
MTALETYLTTLVTLRAGTVPETSHYAALQALLNDVGQTDALKPKVRAVIHPKDTGAGLPDLGLFDDTQPTDQKPARGIVEAKPISDDLLKVAHSPQVSRYLAHYGQALVTTFYQFVLVTRHPQTGQPQIEERYDLAPDAAAFWEAAKQPHALAGKHEVALREYLLRVMRRNAPLATPQEVAWILASYAREAKARIESGAAELTALHAIRAQLETALGVRFEDEAAEDFFRSTLVQTLFYGLFSAWVLWHEKHPQAGKFDLWRDTRRLNIPVMSELFDQFSSGAVLPLSVEQVLEWTTEALNRIERPSFFAAFNKGAAVQYFYEPFLEAFDPQLRRQLGVWYTPPEVVEYMVARVDHALKTELDKPDGLADPSVYVLDPCCGTGAYLVSVLRRIYATLQARDGGALAAQAVQQAMRERVFGFEILPAPFVVAHLQIGMLLNTLHAPLAQGQRAGVYLTNALTGWEAENTPQTRLLFPELQKEREAADEVKRKRPILVILGNPPYSGFAGVAVEEEHTLTHAYRTRQNPLLPAPQGQGLNDLYVRFFRMAERQIVESTTRGIVCFVSNYSWLDGLSHPGMRERYLTAFDQIYIDSLNGDRFRTGKTTPDGLPDPSIFSTEFNREGIQVGTAVATLIRRGNHTSATTVQFRDLWGTGKRAQLQAEAATLPSIAYEALKPAPEIGLPFLPRKIGTSYLTWAKLPELFPTSFPGVKTSRDDVLVNVDKDRLSAVVQAHLAGRIDTLFAPEKMVRYCYRPMDARWLYWDRDLLDRPRPDYFSHVQPGNVWLVSQQKPRREWSMPQAIRSIGCLDLMDRSASCIPLYLYHAQTHGRADTAMPLEGRTPNLSDKARAYLTTLGLTPDAGAEPLFYHALAVLHSPVYRFEHSGALRQDWPRVPLPTTHEALLASAALGREVAALLNVETPVPAVTQGNPRDDLRSVAVLTTTDGKAPDFVGNAGWGRSQGGTVMPGRGRMAEAEGRVDVYLNDTTYWRGVPTEAWAYTLGGYQVLKKWLSYRETAVLGRPLQADEAREFMHICRRLTALLALTAALDANYHRATGHHP